MPATTKKLRCAVYTRKSTDEGLDKEFNTLDAQREACEAFVASQRAEGWVLVRDRYDDGGFSGGTLERPALKRLLADIEAGLVDVIVVYKIDRLSRSLMDFAKLVEAFEAHRVTFVSVTQPSAARSASSPAVPVPLRPFHGVSAHGHPHWKHSTGSEKSRGLGLRCAGFRRPRRSPQRSSC
ncbi:recombinase family protein [Falsiroseomonas ponticola]